MIAQIQIKAMMNHKGALKDMQVKIECTKKKMRGFKARTSW